MSEQDPDIVRRKAVALRYDAESNAAPRVIAMGSGLIAEKILELAKENDIHIHEDPDLLNVLAVLELQSEVPEHLYIAIAEILAFVYRLNNAIGTDNLQPPS
jgi:flagellar biosynthesis protein